MSEPGSFEYIESKIRQTAKGTEFGKDFEQLSKWYLATAPKYKQLIKRVWLWGEWPDRWGPDTGIDLVCETKDGKLWAVQAKADRRDRAVPKSELDSFLADSNRQQFSFRLIVATTDNISRNARRTIQGQQIPVGLELRGDLLSARVQWPKCIGGKPRQPAELRPRPHQSAAIKDVVSGFQASDRGKLIMACGTGKTLTALWIAERLKSRRTLVLVPSLSLISQTLDEWSRNSAGPIDYLAVCSDVTVAHRREDHAVTSINELGIPPTTDLSTIQRFLRHRRRTPSVVFCTYQSSDQIAEAQSQRGTPQFDLVIADEAHRCTGHVDSLFSTVLDRRKIRADKRLFMTATPRFFTERLKSRAEQLDHDLASMDDEQQFGPVFHQLTFEAAISARPPLLTDYRVVVIGVTDKELKRWAEEGRLIRTGEGITTDARTLAAQVGLVKAIRKYDLRKVITFHSSVAKARRFTDASFPDSLSNLIESIDGSVRPTRELWTSHISGETPAGKRQTLLSTFKDLSPHTRGILSNCACLGEGVDVPVLDGIAFIDPRRSTVDIIQAVGRVIRKSAEKRIGTVVIPVYVEESDDPEKILSSSAFKDVWKIINALRAHDRRLADELDQLRLKLGRRPREGVRIQLPHNIKIDIPTLLMKDFASAFYVRAVEKTTLAPPLSVEQILGWADRHYAECGEWPKVQSGAVPEAPSESWAAINDSLVRGARGLAAGSSLARLLAEHRAVRNIHDLPPLSVTQILRFIDEHHEETGEWPNRESGSIRGAPGETWSMIDSSLRIGNRDLPGGSSLTRLLAEQRGVRNSKALPPLSVERILEWLDIHYEETGDWPTANSGAVRGGIGETWAAVNHSLARGRRGLRGGSSISKVLAEHRGKRNKKALPKLSERQILDWADLHFRKFGKYPGESSGDVFGASGETWPAISAALQRGLRGLQRGSSLAKLLAERRGRLNQFEKPLLTVSSILAWADAYHDRQGRWPKAQSGDIPEASGESWANVDVALQQGHRGLPGRSSLLKLLAKERGVQHPHARPQLSTNKILLWADAHHRKYGEWPTSNSGPILEAPGEAWRNVNSALINGLRGLPGGSSLAKLLADRRGKRHPKTKPSLTVKQILAWADSYYEAFGRWPNETAGVVAAAPNEKWGAINQALAKGVRGLPGGSTLAKLIAKHRGVRNKSNLPQLTVRKIMRWVHEHYEHSGEWPKCKSGALVNAPGETWNVIDTALRRGGRGLPGGSSLTKLIARAIASCNSNIRYR